MNNEIKEILEYLNKHKEGLKNKMYYPEDLISCKDLLLLLDYITNLQEENKMLSKECDTYMKISTKKQERIDKAIEYICDYSKSLDERTIIDILKGEDE